MTPDDAAPMRDEPGGGDPPMGPTGPAGSGPAGGRPPNEPNETWRERTALAWIRTTLALAVTGLLCVRLAPSRVATVLGTAVVCAATALVLHNARTLRQRSRRRRERERARSRRGRAAAGREGPMVRSERSDPRPVPDPWMVLLTTVVTILVGVVGLALAFG
jgi:hypothetical protein